MSEQIVKQTNGLLNEEKWTRATLNNYTIGNFKELDSLIGDILEEDAAAEVKQLCDEHLQHTKNSIIALYLSGILALSRQQVDDSTMVTLINIFRDNHKWNIVEYLCTKILQFGENKFALRTLAECYDNENDEEGKYKIWERLVKVDFEEADIVRRLAERQEDQGDTAAAVETYKKAIHRYIGKKQFSNVKEVYHKLIAYCPEDTDFFFHVDSKIAKIVSPERASQLLEDLYAYYRNRDDWDRAIDILKKILDYDPKNQWARKEIAECYAEKYSGHSQLDEYVKLSNLNQSWRNVHEAIEDFEKHIAFDEGNFVCHRSWGVGIISKIDDDEITIDFARKRGHAMSLKMAVSSLLSLGKDHIWVLRAIWPKKKLYDKIKSDTKWALSTIIRSHGNATNMKTIKSELNPGLLSNSEWSSFSTEARKLLKTDPDFGTLPDKLDHFMVRETPISYEEKTFNRFAAEKSFFGRLKTIQEFVANSDPESEFFAEMFDYFVGFVRSHNVVTETVTASYLLVDRILKQYPFLNPGLDVTFFQLFEEIEEIESVFAGIDDAELKRSFLENVKGVEEWRSIYVRLFPYYMSRYILDALQDEQGMEYLEQLVARILDSYREHREAFIWLARNMPGEWFAQFEVPYEKILIGMVHLLDITFREIENRREVSENRRLNRQISTFLFKDNWLEENILKAEEDSVSRIYTLVEDVKDLDPSIKIEMRHKIMEKYPDFRFYGKEKAETVSMGLLVTRAGYEQRRKDLNHILEVEVPDNSKEIGEALKKGDLRENAEYKAAKERQDKLNNDAARLKEELDRAKIFDDKEIDTAKISFGTRVTVKNLESEEVETYSILGPWESDPSNNVISYLSPFGSELWNHTEGEELEFTINERPYRYLVENIEALELSQVATSGI